MRRVLALLLVLLSVPAFADGLTYRGVFGTTSGTYAQGNDSRIVNAATGSGPTAWTPTDQSGAGLTFSVTSAYYYQVGKLVTIVYDITFPTTANGNSVLIGGLPFNSFSSGTNQAGCALTFNTGLAAVVSIAFANSSANFTLHSITGSAPTNVQMTAGRFAGICQYFTS